MIVEGATYCEKLISLYFWGGFNTLWTSKLADSRCRSCEKENQAKDQS